MEDADSGEVVFLLDRVCDIEHRFQRSGFVGGILKLLDGLAVEVVAGSA